MFPWVIVILAVALRAFVFPAEVDEGATNTTNATDVLAAATAHNAVPSPVEPPPAASYMTSPETTSTLLLIIGVLLYYRGRHIVRGH